MVSKTSTESVFAVDSDLHKFPIIVGSAIALVLYLKLITNRQYWVKAEIYVGSICSLAFVFAGYLIPDLIEDDVLSLYIFRLLMTQFASHAVVVYLTEESNDKTVSLVVSMTSLLSRGTLFLVLATDVYRGNMLYMHLFYGYLDLVLVTLFMIGDLYHVFCTKRNCLDYRTVGDPVSLHLSIDALITFFLASVLLGFPDAFLDILMPLFHKTDYHLMMAKWLGVMMFGGSMLSFASLCYKHDEDAVSTLKAKLVVYLPTLLLALKNIYAIDLMQNYGHAAIMLGVVGALVLNAGVMIDKHQKQKQET